MDNSILQFIDNAISSHGTHYDIAKVVYEIYKYEYKILNDGKWYIFDKDKDRWIRITTEELNLRNKIGDYVSNKFLEKGLDYNNLADIETNKGIKDFYLNRGEISQDIGLKLKKSSFKKNIMKECKCLFIDDEFNIKNI